AEHGAPRSAETTRAERTRSKVERNGERHEQAEHREPARAEVREVLRPRGADEAEEEQRRAGQRGQDEPQQPRRDQQDSRDPERDAHDPRAGRIAGSPLQAKRAARRSRAEIIARARAPRSPALRPSAWSGTSR